LAASISIVVVLNLDPHLFTSAGNEEDNLQVRKYFCMNTLEISQFSKYIQDHPSKTRGKYHRCKNTIYF